jgi:hypothetical protein
MVEWKLMSTRIEGKATTGINRNHYRRGEQTKKDVLWRVILELRIIESC